MNLAFLDPRNYDLPKRVFLILAAWLVYLAIFYTTFEYLGPAGDVFRALPVIAASWLSGVGGGLITTFVLWSLNTVVYAVVGFSAPPDFWLASGGNANMVIIAIVVGLLSESRLKLLDENKQRRQAETELADLASDLEQQVASRTIELLEANQKTIDAYDQTLKGWGRAVALKDYETGEHSERVVALSVKLGKMAGFGMDDEFEIRRGAYLHDIGKIGIPDSILLKEGPLTEEEMDVMKTHVQIGYEMVSGISYLQGAVDIPLYHHERWDGKGYPHQISGEAIPLIARIFAIVDVWDALTNDRPYRKAWDKERAMKYINDQRGLHFDPKLVDLFLELIQEAK